MNRLFRHIDMPVMFTRLRLIPVLLLSALLTTRGNAETSYAYLPHDSQGKLQMQVEPRRSLALQWGDWNLLSQSGELFTHDYRDNDPNGLEGSPIGFFSFDDVDPVFGTPVAVQTETNQTSYTWVCSNDSQHYRQVNYAVLRPGQLRVTTTLSFTDDVPAQVAFHPVLFPGSVIGFKEGQIDDRIVNRPMTILLADGGQQVATYPTDPPAAPWVNGSWRAVIFETDNRVVRYSLVSSVPVTSRLFAHAKWHYTNHEGKRRGLVADLRFALNDTRQLTYTIQVDVAASVAQLPPLPEQVEPVDDPSVLLTARPGDDRRFWFFQPDEDVVIPATLRNAGPGRELQLVTQVCDYGNTVIDQQTRQVAMDAGAVQTHRLELGKLPRGAYAVTTQALDNGKLVGLMINRVGVVSREPLSDPSQSFGSFQAYSPNVPAKIELMKWVGIGVVRFRSGNDEMMWNRFEPQPGVYAPATVGTGIARQYHEAGIRMSHYGGFLPPLTPKPSWLTDDQVRFFNYTAQQHGQGNRGYVPRDEQLLSRYLHAYAAEFQGQIGAFQILNEPDLKMSVEDAVAVFKPAAAGIRQAVPHAKIMAADTSQITDFALNWLDRFLSAAGDQVDVITYHHYKPVWYKRQAPTFPILEDTGWEDDLKKITALASKYNKPLSNSEIAWAGNESELFPASTFQDNERDTANTLVRSYLLTRLAGVGDIIHCFGTSLRRPDESYIIYPERVSALVGWQWMVKPVAVAHATAARLLDGTQSAGRVDVGDAHTYVAAFKGNDRAFAALWYTHGHCDATLPFTAEQVELVSIVGQPLPGSDQLTLTAQPVYLVARNIDPTAFLNALADIRVQVRPQQVHFSNLSIDDDGTTLRLDYRLFGGPVKTIHFRADFQDGQVQVPAKLPLGAAVDASVKAEKSNDARIWRVIVSVADQQISGAFVPAGRLSGLPADGYIQIPAVSDHADGPLHQLPWDRAFKAVVNAEDQVGIDPALASQNPVTWQGPNDLSVTARWLYDDQYLYFDALVLDDRHVNDSTSGSGLWAGDSIQIAVDPMCDTLYKDRSYFDGNDHEITLGLVNGEMKTWHRSRSFGNLMVDPDGPVTGIIGGIERDQASGTTHYRVGIPWKALAPLASPMRCRAVRLNFIVNDNDGLNERRTKWIGMTRGIAQTKNPELYRVMVFKP